MGSPFSLALPLPSTTPANIASVPGFNAAPTPTTYPTSPFREIYREERVYNGVHVPAGWYYCCLNIVKKNGIITDCPVEGGYCPEVLFGTGRNERESRDVKEDEKREAGHGEIPLSDRGEVADGVIVSLWTTEDVTSHPWKGVGMAESKNDERNDVVDTLAERRDGGGSHKPHTNAGAAVSRKAGYVLGGMIVFGSLAWVSL